MLGVWSFNHRASKFGSDVSGNTIDAINFYRDWFGGENERCIVAGDLNNSIIWDKTGNDNNFNNINDHFVELGFVSNYHSLKKEIFGKESSATFYHTKKESKKYHIDYMYLKLLETKSVELGAFDGWIKLSDHVPLITEVKPHL